MRGPAMEGSGNVSTERGAGCATLRARLRRGARRHLARIRSGLSAARGTAGMESDRAFRGGCDPRGGRCFRAGGQRPGERLRVAPAFQSQRPLPRHPDRRDGPVIRRRAAIARPGVSLGLVEFSLICSLSCLGRCCQLDERSSRNCHSGASQ